MNVQLTNTTVTLMLIVPIPLEVLLANANLDLRETALLVRRKPPAMVNPFKDILYIGYIS